MKHEKKSVVNNYNYNSNSVLYNFGHLKVGTTVSSLFHHHQKFGTFCAGVHNQRSSGRAVARALIGVGGCIFIYSCFARLISFEINLKT